MAQISKILYIVTKSELGGAQKYIRDLAKFVKKKNFQVFAAAGENGQLLDTLKHLNIETHVFQHLKREISPLEDFLGILEIYFYIKKIKPDIVHLNSTKAGVLGAFAAKLARVKKIVYTVHGFVFLEPLPRWKKILYILQERISAYCKDILICVSSFDKQQGLRYKIAPEKKFHVIYNGMDFENTRFLEKVSARQKLIELLPQYTSTLQKAKFWIGTIANFYPTKGLDILIRAAHEVLLRHPDAVFIVFGDGSERKSLEDIIQKNNLSENFILAGRIPDARQYLKAFDCYVSSSRKEGFPYSLLEALAAEIPIAATKIGGIPEMLGDFSILVAPENPDELNNAIQKALKKNYAAEDLAIKAKAHALKNFSLDKMLEKTFELYNFS